MKHELTDVQKTARAMAALDAMATSWAMTFDIRQAVKAMMALPDGDDRLIKQDHAEGLYAGHMSRQPLTADDLWRSKEVMSLNAELNLSISQLMQFAEAIEHVHGINERRSVY